MASGLQRVELMVSVTCHGTKELTSVPRRYVDYAMQRVRLLRHHRVEPYVVFDGGPLPAKKHTETDRKRRREEQLARGHALAALGRHNEARDCYVKCVDVTPQMAFQLIKVTLYCIFLRTAVMCRAGPAGRVSTLRRRAI